LLDGNQGIINISRKSTLWVKLSGGLWDANPPFTIKRVFEGE
jgi:hypothetical protein